MYREPPLNISPVTEGRARGTEVSTRSPEPIDSCWFDFDAPSVFSTPLSRRRRRHRPPSSLQPASLFAQPEHMLASHYAAHPNFVSLQLFNGHTSVFVCFLAIRLLHLYGWSGGWNNPWHLFREGGVHKEPEVQIHSLFSPFFFYFVKYEAMRPPISFAEIRAVAVF